MARRNPYIYQSCHRLPVLSGVPSACSAGIVSYNLLWWLSLLWGLISTRSIPADLSSVTLLRSLLCHHNRRVVIYCHYAVVVLHSRLLHQLFIYHVYFTFDSAKTFVSKRTHTIVGYPEQIREYFLSPPTFLIPVNRPAPSPIDPNNPSFDVTKSIFSAKEVKKLSKLFISSRLNRF